jgi:hypothetical protein
MYQPTLARFLSRDPLPENGTQILYPLPGASQSVSNLYVYAENAPSDLTDPSGRAPRPECRVQLACTNLLTPGFTVGPRHCGVEIQDSIGISRFHVDNWTTGWVCHVANYRVIPLGIENDYWVQAAGDYPRSVCACIRRTVAIINARARAGDLPYWFVPSNDACGGPSTCNSNYIARCILRNCGLDYPPSYWGTGIPAPVGWSHRMKKCTKSLPCGDIAVHACQCISWKPIDTAWCGPAQ